ncbi:sugar ABC transporter permease [Leucobacter sp. CSA1]|uniref:Sugar ABC transporter permease n=1 Tax=Leucobacter chromiisoli TaxID=2796471 RepID=A0A934Q8U9_9MICO|nr:sugar ABC transporter permease [Leucobacter chromiisoli]MBK0418779.1 sugar ABC transporter permease [Leucobacter chromiisoli]
MSAPSAPSTVAIKVGTARVRVRPNRFSRGMLAPLLIVIGFVVGFPLVYAGYLSFTDYRLTDRGTPDLVWFDSYIGALTNPSFWQAFGTTATYLVIAVTGELVLGLFIAMALQKQRWAKDLTRALLLAPMFITPIAVGLTFRFLLNDQLGAVPELLSRIGVSYDFLGSGKALITLAFIDMWQWTPFMVLLLLAGLESLPKAPLEAARVDGASWWYTFRRVMLPLLSPVLVIAVLLRALDAMKVFEYVYATTRGGPGEETQTLQYFTYQTGIQFFRLGSASAMAFIVLAVVLTVIVVIYRRMERSREQ